MEMKKQFTREETIKHCLKILGQQEWAKYMLNKLEVTNEEFETFRYKTEKQKSDKPNVLKF